MGFLFTLVVFAFVLLELEPNLLAKLVQQTNGVVGCKAGGGFIAC